MQPTTKPEISLSLWQSVKEALRAAIRLHHGQLKSFDSSSCHTMVLEMVLESLLCCSRCLLGKPTRANAVATVGLTESVLTLVFAVGMGLGMSTTAMVARRIGEKDADGAAVSAVQAVFLGLIVFISCLAFPLSYSRPDCWTYGSVSSHHRQRS